MTRSRGIRATVLALAAASCQDSAKTGPAETLAQFAVTYVCENDFDLESRSSSAITVAYQVIGTSETGKLRLPAGSTDAPSRTRLTTLASGDLTVSSPVEASSTVANRNTRCPVLPSTSEPGATTGEWSRPF